MALLDPCRTLVLHPVRIVTHETRFVSNPSTKGTTRRPLTRNHVGRRIDCSPARDKEARPMNRGRALEIGGIVAGVVLIIFGIGALVLGIDARNTVEDELTQRIVGSPDMSPDAIEQSVQEAGLENVDIPSCDVAEGDHDRERGTLLRRIHAHPRARVFGRAHVRAMGRFVSAEDPSDPAGTSDEAAAAKDEDGKPVSNAARNTWVPRPHWRPRSTSRTWPSRSGCSASSSASR